MTSPRPPRPAGPVPGVLAITVTAVLWGTTGTVATFAPEAGPLAIGSAALGVGGLLQAVVAVGALRRARTDLARRWVLLLVGGLAVVSYPLAFYSSMHLAGVAVGTAVSLASAPLFSGVIEALADRRRPRPRWIAAAALGVAGTALTCAAHGGAARAEATQGSVDAAGVLLGLLAGLAYASYSWVVQRLLRDGIPRAAAMGAVFGLGGAGLLPVLAFTGAPLMAHAGSLAVAAYMALVPMFAGYLLFGLGLTRVPASTATTITLLEPAVATVLAVAVVGEVLGTLGWLGMALLGLSLMMLVRPGTRSPRPDAGPSGA